MLLNWIFEGDIKESLQSPLEYKNKVVLISLYSSHSSGVTWFMCMNLEKSGCAHLKQRFCHHQWIIVKLALWRMKRPIAKCCLLRCFHLGCTFGACLFCISEEAHFLSRRSIRGRRTVSASIAALLPLAEPFIWTSSWFICFTQSSMTGLKLGESKTNTSLKCAQSHSDSSLMGGWAPSGRVYHNTKKVSGA